MLFNIVTSFNNLIVVRVINSIITIIDTIMYIINYLVFNSIIVGDDYVA